MLVAMCAEMLRLAKPLPEYDTVLAMYGVGKITAAQLMSEIGVVRRYPRRSSLVAFSGVDPAVNQSDKHEAQRAPTTKRGSSHLRKTLYQIACTYLKKSPVDEPVYLFLDKKHAEGKTYFVYMTAGANKFLRIYYARVKECLSMLDNAPLSLNYPLLPSICTQAGKNSSSPACFVVPFSAHTFCERFFI